MRIYLCTDMEGASGVTTPEEFEPGAARVDPVTIRRLVESALEVHRV